MFEYVNTLYKKKHVYKHNCFSVTAILSIPAHLAHLAQMILNAMNK